MAESSDDHAHVALATARKRLKLASGLFSTAVAAGLLAPCHPGRFDVSVIAAACTDPIFPLLAAAAVELNATQAAALAGVTKAQFHRAVTAAAIIPSQVTPWKYGNSISWFRTGDVQRLAAASWWTVDTADRVIASVSNRSLGAQKAAETRRLKVVARLALTASIPAADADALEVTIWAAAILTGVKGWWRSDRLAQLPEHLDGQHAGFNATVGTVQQCRFNAHEAGGWSNTARARLKAASGSLVYLCDAVAQLGVLEAVVIEYMTTLADTFVSAAELQQLLAEPPAWVNTGRIDRQISLMEDAERKSEIAREKQLAAAVAEAMPKFIPLEDVAAIFGVPIDLLAAWRPRWSVPYVENLQRDIPRWLKSEHSVRAELLSRERSAAARSARKAARSARKAARAPKKAARIAQWRQQWADALGIPLDQVPNGIGNATTHAVEAMRRSNPAWSRPA